METVKAKTRIYDQVVNKIKELISEGDLPQGSALPPERQLIDELNVSRSSLREGFRVLEMMGLIESIPGKGRFVRTSRSDGGLTGRVPLQDEAILTLVEARLVLDPAIAIEAAKHASPSDLTKIRRILTKTGKDVESLEYRAQCDYDFHLVLAESTHNFIFVNIVKMTFNLIMATHERIYALLDDKEIFLREHEEIYDALVVRDLDRVSILMSRHVQRVYRTLQNAIAMESVAAGERT